MTTPQRLADAQQFTKESLLFGEQLIGCGDVVPWLAEASKERKTERTVRVWSTPAMPETLTERERQSLPVEEARGSQQVYSLTSRPTS